MPAFSWTDTRPGPTTDIFGARIDSTGTVLDLSGIGVSTATDNQTSAAVAFDGTQYLAAWTDRRSGASKDIYGARVDALGVVTDVGGIPISTAPNDQDSPAVAANGAFFVVWRDRRSGTNFDIYGSEVKGDGTVSQPAGATVAQVAQDEQSPHITNAPGDDFGVAYSRARPQAPFLGASRALLRTVSPK